MNSRRPNANHLRSTYEACLAKVLVPDPAIEDLEQLAKVAITYAMTSEGIARIKKDIGFAKINGDVEREIILTKVMKKALSAMGTESSPSYVQLPLQMPTENILGTRPLKDWNPDKPVWPKTEVMIAAIRDLTKIPMEEEELAKKVYRHLYAKYWRECFYDNSLKIFHKPYNDDEGWRWRDFAIDKTAKMINEAFVVKPKDLKPGMHIYNNFGVRVVYKLLPTGSAKFAREEGVVKTLGVYTIQYTDGNMDRMVPDDTLLVRLPKLEEESGTHPKIKNIPPLDLS